MNIQYILRSTDDVLYRVQYRYSIDMFFSLHHQLAFHAEPFQHLHHVPATNKWFPLRGTDSALCWIEKKNNCFFHEFHWPITLPNILLSAGTMQHLHSEDLWSSERCPKTCERTGEKSGSWGWNILLGPKTKHCFNLITEITTSLRV